MTKQLEFMMHRQMSDHNHNMSLIKDKYQDLENVNNEMKLLINSADDENRKLENRKTELVKIIQYLHDNLSKIERNIDSNIIKQKQNEIQNERNDIKSAQDECLKLKELCEKIQQYKDDVENRHLKLSFKRSQNKHLDQYKISDTTNISSTLDPKIHQDEVCDIERNYMFQLQQSNNLIEIPISDEFENSIKKAEQILQKINRPVFEIDSQQQFNTSMDETNQSLRDLHSKIESLKQKHSSLQSYRQQKSEQIEQMIQQIKDKKQSVQQSICALETDHQQKAIQYKQEASKVSNKIAQLNSQITNIINGRLEIKKLHEENEKFNNENLQKLNNCINQLTNQVSNKQQLQNKVQYIFEQKVTQQLLAERTNKIIQINSIMKKIRETLGENLQQ